MDIPNKNPVLTEITESLEKLRSVGVSFEWKDGERKKDGTDEITGEYHYFEVFDDYRNYLKQSKTELFVEAELAATAEKSGFDHLRERSWNGALTAFFRSRIFVNEVMIRNPYFKKSGAPSMSTPDKGAEPS